MEQPTSLPTTPAGVVAAANAVVGNLVLLCGQHHRTIHHTPWEVRLNPQDGRPEFLPPPKRGQPTTRLDPQQTRRE